MQHCGMEVLPGDIVINDTDLMYRRTEANCDWGSISLSRDDLDAVYNAVTGREFTGLARKHLTRPPPELMSRLLSTFMHSSASSPKPLRIFFLCPG